MHFHIMIVHSILVMNNTLLSGFLQLFFSEGGLAFFKVWVLMKNESIIISLVIFVYMIFSSLEKLLWSGNFQSRIKYTAYIGHVRHWQMVGYKDANNYLSHYQPGRMSTHSILAGIVSSELWILQILISRQGLLILSYIASSQWPLIFNIIQHA